MLSGSDQTLPGLDRLPVLVDLSARTVSPVAGLAPAQQFALVEPIVLLRGHFARVTAGTDCLNLRQQPAKDASVLGCFADGVLLRLRDQPDADADGIAWVALQTPAGKDAWASGEFLQR